MGEGPAIQDPVPQKKSVWKDFYQNSLVKMSTMDEDNARQSVVELLNDAAMAMDPNEKLESLTKVKELIIHKVHTMNKLTMKLKLPIRL